MCGDSFHSEDGDEGRTGAASRESIVLGTAAAYVDGDDGAGDDGDGDDGESVGQVCGR